jgi:hypothetical protein
MFVSFRFEESQTVESVETEAPFLASTPRAPFVVTTMLDERPFQPTTPASFTGGPTPNRFPSFWAAPVSQHLCAFLLFLL